jgi:hypothetical protein
MKFEELSAIWHNNDLTLDKSIRINKEFVKNLGISKVAARHYEIKLTAMIGIMTGILFTIFLCRFIFEYFTDLKFSVPAMILLVTTCFGLVIEFYNVSLLYTINPESTVEEARKKLIRLKKLEIMNMYSLFVVIPLFAAPFMIVMAKAFLHFDLYAFNTGWLIYFTAGSIIIAVILIYFLRKFSGKKLAQSISFLNELRDEGNLL